MKMRRYSPLLTVPAKGALLAALFAFYLALRPLGIHVSDSYAWVNTVESESFYYFFHPHHVLYLPLAWRWTQLVRLVFASAETWAALAALSALSGCAGVAAVYKTMRVLAARPAAAIAAGALQAFVFGYWFFAGEPEVYVVSAACALWAMYFLARLACGGQLRAAGWAGAAAGLAALFHQTGIFLFVPAVVVSLSRPRRKTAAKAAGLFAAGFAAVVVPVYLCAAWAALGTLAPSRLAEWVFHFAGEGYGGLEWTSPLAAAVGFGRSIIGGQAVLDVLRQAREPGPLMWAGVMLGGGGVICLCAFLVRAAAGARGARGAGGTTALAALAGFAVYGLFSVYFDPANFEWWTIPLSLLILGAAALALSGPRPAIALAFWAALLVGAANLILDFSYRRNPENDLIRNAARSVAALTGPQDVIVVPSYLGSVLWYENRERNIFCPEKAVRVYGRTGAHEVFARMLAEAEAAGARLVIAGAEAQEDTRLFAGSLLVGVDAHEQCVIGSIKFFSGDKGLVRTVSPWPIVAVDAAVVRGGLTRALAARAR